MAKIMKTSAQEEALQTIVGNLKLTERLNAVMDNVEILEAGTITVQADKDKVTMELPAAVLNKLLGDVRKAKVAEVKTQNVIPLRWMMKTKKSSRRQLRKSQLRLQHLCRK